MARSEEIAQLIPLYRQFIATERAQAQRQAAKLRPASQTAVQETPTVETTAAAVDGHETEDLPTAAKEVLIDPDET